MRRLSPQGWFILVMVALLVGSAGWMIWTEVASRVECRAVGGRMVSTNGRWMTMTVYDPALKMATTRPVYVTDDICVTGLWPFRDVSR